jgi:hypothetical protein
LVEKQFNHPLHGLDRDIEAAISKIDKKLRDLGHQRELILAGEPVEEPAAPPISSVTPRALRLPKFYIDKAVERVPVPAELGLMLTDTAHLDEYCRLVDAHYAKGAMHDIEQVVRECVEGFRERGSDHERAFSQSLYFGLCKAAATLQAQINGCMHFQTHRRREIEVRVDALEKRGEAAEKPDLIAELEKRIKSLEAHIEDNPPIIYRGVWTEGVFEKNNAVTSGGSLWIAKRRTSSQPHLPTGGAETDWQLACKRGRDGKDFIK